MPVVRFSSKGPLSTRTLTLLQLLLLPKMASNQKVHSLGGDRCSAVALDGAKLNELSSPRFPDKYPPLADCIRTIDAPDGYDILVRFKQIFQIESAYSFSRLSAQPNAYTPYNCPSDFLELRDGRFPFSPLLARLCGMRLPQMELRSRSGHLWLWFHSDALFEYAGFLAEYEFVRADTESGLRRRKAKECHFSSTTALDGHIQSEQLSHIYKERRRDQELECIWTIQVPKWLRIALFVENLELAAPNQCAENSLELFAGQFASEPFRKFCGMTATHLYTGESIVHLRLFVLDEAHLFASRFRIFFSTYARLPNCSEHNFFDCGDEICIPKTLVCNGRANCLYRRDELDCDWSFNLFEWLLHSGHLPLFVLLSILSVAVTALCLYYKPCSRKSTIVGRSRKLVVSDSSPNNLNATANTTERTRCSSITIERRNGGQTRVQSLVYSKSAHSGDDEWSLSDLSLREHHANCGHLKGPKALKLPVELRNHNSIGADEHQRRGTLMRQTLVEEEQEQQQSPPHLDGEARRAEVTVDV